MADCKGLVQSKFHTCKIKLEKGLCVSQEDLQSRNPHHAKSLPEPPTSLSLASSGAAPPGEGAPHCRGNLRILAGGALGPGPENFDDDGTLDKKDLEKLVNSLTGEGEDSRLSLLEMEQLIQNILEESDIDKDGTINLSEFQHIISRSPDFTSAQFIGSQTNVSPRLSFPKTGCSTRVSPFTGVFQEGLRYHTSYPPSNGPSHTGQRNRSQVPTDPEEAHRQVVPFRPLLAVLVRADRLS
ncbi:Calcium and integrin-binding protein 1, partial [Ophiophagus hannah]